MLIYKLKIKVSGLNVVFNRISKWQFPVKLNHMKSNKLPLISIKLFIAFIETNGSLLLVVQFGFTETQHSSSIQHNVQQTYFAFSLNKSALNWCG